MWKPSGLLEIADKASFSSQNVETVQKLRLNKQINRMENLEWGSCRGRGKEPYGPQ